MRALAIALHLLLALAVLVFLVRQLGMRAQEVSDIRGLAAREHLDTLRMQREMQLHQDLLTAVRTKNPYVIELLARDRLNYTRPNEFTPPPIAHADKR
jgi:hypothetical protein